MVLTSNQKAFLNQLHNSLETLDQKHTSFKGMIYGDSGVGKTVSSMALTQAITPSDKSILYIDSAEGWVSLDNHKSLKVRTNYVKFQQFEIFEALAAAIRDGIKPWDTIGTVVLDEHSSMAIDDLDEVVLFRSKTNAGKDPDTPVMPDYNTNTNRTRKYLADLIQLPHFNVILTAHQRSDKDNMQREKIGPNYLPKLSSTIRGMLHLVAYMTADIDKEEKVVVRKFQCHPTTRIVAKTRIGGLPPVTTLRELANVVNEWLLGDHPTEPAPEPEVINELPEAVMEEE